MPYYSKNKFISKHRTYGRFSYYFCSSNKVKVETKENCAVVDFAIPEHYWLYGSPNNANKIFPKQIHIYRSTDRT